jgi:Holliday junction resolvasome RuvABC endonuclease subunit
MTTVLGFDVSSSTTGYCFLDYNDKNKVSLLKLDYIKPIKTGTIIERLVDTRNKIKDIIEETKPDIIAIEEIIAFMKGSSTANTIITLTSFNRMIGLAAYDYLQRSPEMFSVLQIRHGIRRAADLKKLPAKEDLPNIMEKLLKIKFPWEYNKKGKQIIENYDKCDALCVAFYCATKDTLSKKK